MLKNRYITFSHTLGTWLKGKPGEWTPCSPHAARFLVDNGYSLMDV